MRRVPALLALVLASLATQAQVSKIVIPAGTPEDQAIQAITKEGDAQKRVGMLEEFLQRFAGNPAAVAYGNWQLAQNYSGLGDNAKGFEYGEKALAAAPNNLDILMSQAGLAQQMNNTTKVVEYAVRGGVVYNSIAKQPKPADVEKSDFDTRIAEEKRAAQPAYNYLESAGLNAIAGEQDPKKRMTYIERYLEAFPGGQFEEKALELAVYSLNQLNDSARLLVFGEKALASNPNSIPTLLVLSSALADDAKPSSLTKASAYARKAIELAKADAADADQGRKLSAGIAHSTLGYVLLRQEKTPAAIAELKTASALLKPDRVAYSTALYRLGFAYAKLNRVTEARQVLNEAVTIEGPVQKLSRDLLNKVNAAKATP
jgi:tetratricopeptide (TPR) repeat protein